jgi:DNA-binding LytR/AlgR family response regulator
MIRCLAIDDEPLALELLQDNISKVPFLQLVAACDNAIEALQVMEEQPVDLVFLDIQMPGLTGLQLIQSMAVKPMFILITAYEKYALEGFNLDVTDYLVKPVPLDRFIKACYKAKELFELKNAAKENDGPGNAEYFFVNVEYSLVKIIIADIIYVEGLKDYLKIQLKSSSKPIITRMTMKAIEDQLPPKLFIRIHKSYIAGVNYITSIRKTSLFLDNIELPVSDFYREAITALTSR